MTGQTLAPLEGQVHALYHHLEALNATITSLPHELALKDFEIACLKRMLFGQRRERFEPQTPWLPGLLPAAQDDATSHPCPAPEKPTRERRPRKTARSRLDVDATRVAERHVTPYPTPARARAAAARDA